MDLGIPGIGARERGFTLVETAIVVLMIGMLLAAVVQGQELIRSARVRALIAEQEAVATAVLGFQDRYLALPGDYANAASALACDPACANGNGNGRIEEGSTPSEAILAWSHLSHAGFLNRSFVADTTTTVVQPENTPKNEFGGYMQMAFDSNWGYSTNPARRHSIKTGNGVPAQALAEVDRKIDDGLPTSGRFQFSPYAAGGTPLSWGGAADACVTADGPGTNTLWNTTADAANCGAASLL
jgi:type II secretory pathway pseudopilin PulG